MIMTDLQFYNAATLGSCSYSPCPIVVLCPFWEYKRLQSFWIALESYLLDRGEEIQIVHYRATKMKSHHVQHADLTHARLVIGNDAGVCAAAVAAGIPTIRICNAHESYDIGGDVRRVTVDQVITRMNQILQK